MSEETWIEQQKKNPLFMGSSLGSDANKMLEISPTNRVISGAQGRKLTGARYINQLLGITAIGDLCDLVEQAQLCVDARSRQDFMKVAIEQWQGKVQSNKKLSLENLV